MRTLALTYNGKSFPNRKDFCRRMKIDYNRLNSLINYRGLSLEEAANILITERDKIMQAVNEVNSNTTMEVYVTDEKENLEPSTTETTTEATETKEEPKPIKTFTSPIYFTVLNPVEVINIIENFKDYVDTINLIDFENVVNNNDLLRDNIYDPKALNIFFYNATIYSNDFYTKIKKSSNINVQVHIFECGKELVDHLITYYLGAIRINYPDLKYNIISKDFGFYPFINSLNSDKVNGIGRKYLESPELRYKFSLCKYIVENNIFKSRKIIATHEVGNFFGKFYTKGITNDDIKDLLSSFKKFNLVSVEKKGEYEWATFNLEEITKFYEENR